MKKILLLLITLMVGLVAQATLQTGISMQGMKRTVNGKTYFSFAIQTMWGGDQIPAQEGSSYTFNNATIACVTLNGTLNFQEMSSFTDVITGSSFTVTIENNSLWFYGATVQTKSGTDVTGCSASVSSNKHTLTVTIPSGKTFATIIVDYVSNAPFSSSNTVISGLENSYLYLGSPIEPEPVVTYNGTMLTKDTDYTLSYWGSNRVGEAQVTVTGMNEYAGDISKSYTIRKVALTDFNSLGNKTYEIATTTDLDYLALYITGSDDGSGITFKQTADIAYAHSSSWNDNNGENNFTAIGGYGNSFCGTYDGQNHTISGIRIYKNGTTNYDTSQGLFGFISSGAIVKKVILADAKIVGYNNTGGIVGYNCGTIEDCQVESNVDIRSVRQSNAVGGIAGISNGNNTTGVAISRCTFKGRVKHTEANSTNVGGIVGTLTNCPVSNCLVLGAHVYGHDYSGAIAGYKTSNSTLTANYYHDSEVSNTDNRSGAYINVGVGIGSGSEDQEGARSVHALTLPNGVTATGESVDIDGVTHYAAATTVTLACSNVPEGYMAKYSVDGNTITGDTFTMPTADATVTAVFGLSINQANFPDANFRNWLLSQSYGSDEVLTDEEIAGITVLNLDNKSISDLTGIEHFTALTGLSCNNNQLTTLDVSHNTALTDLFCTNNQLTALDVSQNSELRLLRCYSNQLTALDVTGCTELKQLPCYDNQLTSLDVRQNTALTHLNCYNNQLTSLDVSHNTELITLFCHSNQLTSLDVSVCAALNMLYCNDNQIYGENMAALVASLPIVVDGSGTFRVIDLDSDTEQNVITTTQVATARGKNWDVKGYVNGGWQDYDGSPEGLPIDSINFPDVNFRDYLLSQDYGSDRVLTDEEIASITSLYVSGDSIADLMGIEHFTALTTLQCNKNQLQTLDVSRNTALTHLYCNYNQLTALDVSHNTALTTLQCGENSLTALDVSQNTALTGLSCANNQLTTLDVSHNAYLTRLQCSENQLSSLDVSHNTDLNRLYCSGNQLTALDVSHNTALTELFCGSNQLQMLDVSHNTALEWLFCNNNQLTALDVSHNTALTELQCDDNQIYGDNMAALVAGLPTVAGNSGTFRVINLDSDTEQNVITTTQVTTARGKNWEVLGRTNDNWTAYDGSAEGLAIDSINFPDANFRNYLLSQSYGSDAVLTDEEIAGIFSISVAYESIADLTGIEHFTALTGLYCNGNQLTSLDVSHNTALKYLDCGLNQLALLNVSLNTALTTLNCYNNQLAELDVSQNTALEYLQCYNNQLTALDLSHTTALEGLHCSDNQLTALDLSHNTALTWLVCYNNQINGGNMEALVASLLTVDVENNWGSNGDFYVINLDSDTEQNIITATQVATALGKNWTVWGCIDGFWQEYGGSEPPIEVAYIDENRETQSHESIVLTGNETSLGKAGEESWYVASGTLNYDETLPLNGDVHLILADGAVMNIGTTSAPISGNAIEAIYTLSKLTIYGQTLDDDTAGHLNIYSNQECTYIYGEYAQHSGNVTMRSIRGNGLCTERDITLTGGTLNISTDKNAIYIAENIEVIGDIYILGGKLSAIAGNRSYGILTYGNVTLGWKDADDEITLSGLLSEGNGTINIVEGQAFTDGENTYDSTTPSDVLWALTGVTLRPVVPLEGVTFTADRHWATYYGTTDLAIPEGISVYTVDGISGDMTSVTQIGYIPARVGVLLHSETALESVSASTWSGTTATVTSLLEGSTEPREVSNAYVLYNDNFVLVQDGTTVAAHRCYLPVPNAVNAPARLRIGDNGVPTAIDDITSPTAKTGQRYNLLGQPVGNDYKGIVIENGQKKIIK